MTEKAESRKRVVTIIKSTNFANVEPFHKALPYNLFLHKSVTNVPHTGYIILFMTT